MNANLNANEDAQYSDKSSQSSNKSKLSALKKIFQPWKWKRKKSEKLATTSTILERKLSVRSTKEQLYARGILKDDCKEDKVTPRLESVVELDNVRETSWVSEVGVVPPPEMFSPKELKLNRSDSVTGIIGDVDLSDGEDWPEEMSNEDNLKLASMRDVVVKALELMEGGTNTSEDVDATDRIQLETLSKDANDDSSNVFPNGHENIPSPTKRRMEEKVNDKENRTDENNEEENWNKSKMRRIESLSLKVSQRPPLKELKDRNIFPQISKTEWEERRKKIGSQLAVKLSSRPNLQELVDRNIISNTSKEDLDDTRRIVEAKLERKLSIRPTENDLKARNILRKESEEEVKRKIDETKVYLERKLSYRPTPGELKRRKILKFNDYIEVNDVEDYDRKADKPWTRLTPKAKADIRKELNEFKASEMEVHIESRHRTRFHKP